MYTDLDGVLVGEEVDDLERVRNNADGEELLAVVAALHHQAEFRQHRHFLVCAQNSPVNEALDDRHLRLLELLLGVTASGVGEVYRMTDLDVIGEGDVLDFDTIEYKQSKMHEQRFALRSISRMSLVFRH